MKSAFSKKPNPEIENDEEDAEIDDAGPKIAAGKKGKMAIIVASSILVTVVIYTMFFKSEPAPKDKLEEVQIAPTKVSITPSEDGKSPFEIEAVVEKPKDKDAAVFDKPLTPDVPTLPELPKDAVASKDDQLLPPDPVSENKDAKTAAQVPAALPAGQLPIAALPAGQLPIAALPAGQFPIPSIPPVAAAQQHVDNPQNSQSFQTQNNQPSNQQESARKEENDDLGIDTRYAPIVVLSGGAGPASSVGYDNNIVDRKKNSTDSLEKTTSDVVTTFIEDRTHTIAQGKLITAVLETAINTEIPGFVRGIVSRNVYGESGTVALIPKGSRLFGAYSSQIVRGQGRVNIGWTRLIRPDGVSLAIGFNASDQFGRSGILGDVDNRYGTVIANSLLTSVLAIGTAVAAEKLSGNNNAASSTTTNPTQGTVTTTGKASNQIIYDVTKTIIDTVSQVVSNTLNTSPVIRVPQGTRITIVVNADIKVP